MLDALANISGMEVLIDDILVHGKSLSDHNSWLEQVLTTFKQGGLTLNKNKCVVEKEHVDFLSH